MSQSTVNVLARKWFEEYARLAYWIGRRWTRRLLDWRGHDYAASDLEELAQDAVARGYDRFCKVQNKVRGVDRKKWVCRCMVRACQDAVRAKSRFGNPSDPVAIRDDATNRKRRVRPSARHGSDSEREYLDVEYIPVVPIVQRWEVEELVDKWLPEHTRKTAIYAAMGFSQPESALLQGCSERTIRNRLQDIREHLDPSVNWYAVLCSALECARRDTWKPWTTR